MKYSSILYGLVIVLSGWFTTCVKEDQPVDIRFAIEADSVVIIRDTLKFKFRAEQPVPPDVRYCFIKSPSFVPDTSDQPEMSAVWQINDTGNQQIIVYAIQGEELVSARETLLVAVRAQEPKVYGPESSVAGVNKIYAYKCTVSDSDGTVSHLEWTKDNLPAMITHPDSLLYIRWELRDTGSHVISVVAIDNDGLRSEPDTFLIQVGSRQPTITSVEGDTTISVNDTMKLVINGDDEDGYITSFLVTDENNPSVVTTVTSKLFMRAWNLSDSGSHHLVIRAVDNDGRRSEPHKVTAQVSADCPIITVTGASKVLAGDTIMISAGASDPDGKVIRYHWSILSSDKSDDFSTADSTFTYQWERADAGTKIISVYAIDDDSLKSATVQCTLVVFDDRPMLKQYPDTTVSSADTFQLVRNLTDTTRLIKQYYWAVQGLPQRDSSIIPEFTMIYTGVRSQQVIVTAVDAANETYSDTVSITYNRPPVVKAAPLILNDTLWTREKNVPGIIRCKFMINDPDGDAVSLMLLWGRGEHYDTLDAADSVSLTTDSTGLYHWKFIIKDSFGNNNEMAGSTHVGIEHTICFAGHSIVTGLGMVGSERVDSAGFRPHVLEGLRSTLNSYERIRPVGPFSPGIMNWRPQDDSCFAISGSFAREMLLLMDHAYTQLSADIWVMMLGVNGSFSGIESQASVELIKRMFTRNPAARVYVLTSQPFSNAGYVRVAYNRTLRDTVTALKSRGMNAFIVETGDSILSSNDAFNDTLAWDAVHPNLEGYRRIGDGILKVMLNRIPKVIPMKNDIAE